MKMRRSVFVLALAVATVVTAALLAYGGIICLWMGRYGTGMFALGGTVMLVLFAITYFRDWRRIRHNRDDRI